MPNGLSRVIPNALLLTLALLGCGCTRPEPTSEHADPSAPVAAALPPLELKDETRDLFLTWVDDKGDFHVAQKIADVPEARREKVRVVVTTREAGTGAHVYVADLRSKRGDGSYAVATWSRAQWDDVGATLRKARLEALAPKPANDAASDTSARAANEAPLVVIYGSDSCGPCHMAARYLKEHNVRFVEKKIDESDAARAELEQKLRRANLPDRGQIPVIDVGGRLLIGYDPDALGRALADATPRTL